MKTSTDNAEKAILKTESTEFDQDKSKIADKNQNSLETNPKQLRKLKSLSKNSKLGNNFSNQNEKSSPRNFF